MYLGCGDICGLRDAAALHDVFLEVHGVRETFYCCVGEEPGHVGLGICAAGGGGERRTARTRAGRY